jgi:hypothetical protein
MAGFYGGAFSYYSPQKMMGGDDQFLAAIMEYTMSLMGMNIDLMPQGSFVKMLPLAPGSYTNVDLTLEHACAFGSLAVPTDSGVLQTSDPLVLRFVGNADLAQSSKVVLNVGDILDALSNARNSADVKAITASVNGTF